VASVTAGHAAGTYIPLLKGGEICPVPPGGACVVNLSRPVEFCPAMCRGGIGYRDEMGRMSQNAFCPGKLHRMGQLNFVPVSLKRSSKGKLKYNQCHHHLDAPKFKLISLKRNHSSETGKGDFARKVDPSEGPQRGSCRRFHGAGNSAARLVKSFCNRRTLNCYRGWRGEGWVKDFLIVLRPKFAA
jgi:hypothetical protein